MGTGFPILMYHDLDERRSVLAVPPAVFAAQMRWLHAHGYRAISVSELGRHLREGRPLPARAVAITFDDGFESVYTAAFPVLVRYGFTATVFVVAGHCGGWNDWPHQPSGVPRRPLLTWAQIRELDRHGIEVGGHSVSHPRLDRLPPEAVEREALESKARIEEQLGHPIGQFAYPYGRHTALVRATVGRVYDGACTARLGLVRRDSDPLALERIDVYYLTRPVPFRILASPLLGAYLGVRRHLRTAASTLLGRPWV